MGRKQDGVAAAREMAAHSGDPLALAAVAVALAMGGADFSLAGLYAQQAVSTAESELKDTRLSMLDGNQLHRMAVLAAIWDAAGWVSSLRGDRDQGLRYAEAAWKLSQMASVGDHLGQMYEDRGDDAAAIRMWKLALAADPREIDTRNHLAKADPKSSPDPARPEELEKMRTVAVPGYAQTKGTAEFFVLLSTKEVEDVAFISGDDELRAAKDAIAKAKFDMPFPDNGPEKIARRGILSCSQSNTPNCQLVLVLPSNTTPP
jgi:hypothetical protein